jgi:hypothetical protein
MAYDIAAETPSLCDIHTRAINDRAVHCHQLEPGKLNVWIANQRPS